MFFCAAFGKCYVKDNATFLLLNSKFAINYFIGSNHMHDSWALDFRLNKTFSILIQMVRNPIIE